jgi:hypothetical protein
LYGIGLVQQADENGEDGGTRPVKKGVNLGKGISGEIGEGSDDGDVTECK